MHLVSISGGDMQYYTTAIHLGSSIDTSSTELSVSAFLIQNCTADIVQEGHRLLTSMQVPRQAPKLALMILPMLVLHSLI